MKIQIAETPTSAYVLDDDWSEYGNDELHLALRCRHDQIFYDKEVEDMWCPDCQNEHLTTDERLEYLRSHDEPGDESRRDDG